jgi:beta-lactamase class C
LLALKKKGYLFIMRNGLRLCVLLSLFFAVSSSIAATRVAATDNSAQTLDTKISNIMKPWMQKRGIPGAVVEVYSNGVPHAYYFGYADMEKTTPVNGNTIFEIGSVTKLFTSILLAQEVLHQDLKLNDTAATYIPEFQARTKTPFWKITLRNLATHTAGLPYDEPSTVKTNRDALSYFSRWQTHVRIGQSWAYSNVGMGLLGYVLENKMHKPINVLYQQNILTPLGMTPLGTTVPAIYEPYRAKGYNRAGNLMPSKDYLFTAASAIKASGNDMQKFMRAALLLPGTPPNIANAMRLTQTPFASAGTYQQGLGWVIIPLQRQNDMWILPKKSNSVGPTPAIQLSSLDSKYNARAIIEKTGTLDGFRSYIGIIPATQSGVVMLTNRYPAFGDTTRVGHQLLLAASR